MAQRIAGHMWSIECEAQAAQPVPHRNCQDGSRQTIGKIISRGCGGVDVIGPMSQCRFEQGIAWIEYPSCNIPCAIECGALEDMVLLAKDACGSKSERVVHSLDELRFNLIIVF